MCGMRREDRAVPRPREQGHPAACCEVLWDMIGGQEKGEAVANSTRDYPTYRNVRYLPLLLLLSFLIPLSGASLPVNIYLQNSTTNPALTFPSLAGAPICANTLGGTCAGNDVISGTNTLSSDLLVIGNFLLTGGSSLTTNGFYISATQNIQQYWGND